MALQNSVGIEHAIGVPGDLFVPDQAMYYPENLLAGEAGVTCGKFVAISNGVLVDATGEGFIGIAQRNLSYPLATTIDDGTLTIPEGQPVQVVTKGDMIVAATDNAVVGASVYINATGDIVTVSASGAVDTGWKVATPATAGGYMVIYNH